MNVEIKTIDTSKRRMITEFALGEEVFEATNGEKVITIRTNINNTGKQVFAILSNGHKVTTTKYYTKAIGEALILLAPKP